MTVRKSKALRLSQTQALLQTYITTPMLQQLFNWDFRFLTDIEFKLRMGKKISRRQRNMLDEKIAEGAKQIPVIRDNPLLDSLKSALEILKLHPSTQSFAIRVGSDMVVKMTKGIKPSEKQAKMIEGFINTAEELKHLQPLSAERLDRANLVLEAAGCYSEHYWCTHSAGARAISALRTAVQSNLPITDKQYSSAEYAVRGTLKKLDNPKFQSGNKCKVSIVKFDETTRARSSQKMFGIIIAGPFVNQSRICYDVLVDGELQTKVLSAITKR